MEVKYMHINPYTTDSGELIEKAKNLDHGGDEDNFKTVREIKAVMDYVDDMQMEALTSVGKEERDEKQMVNASEDKDVNNKLNETFKDALKGFEDIKSGLDDE